ncbi:hypothetical protein P3T29_005933 [Kitasatospora sp. MAP5-34]|nr:hypothetical protein [Kitasatospora sp. MAP5-34]
MARFKITTSSGDGATNERYVEAKRHYVEGDFIHFIDHAGDQVLTIARATCEGSSSPKSVPAACPDER